jgi:hypothetical protein
MRLEEKREKAPYFIANELGWASYVSMELFRFNVQIMISVVELEGILLKKLENNEIKHTMSEEQLIRVKQFILLDSLSKIMIIIEGLLVLCSALSRVSRKNISSKMMRYTQEQIDAFIKRFKRGKASIWRIAGFPNLGMLQRNCGLDDEERKLLWKLFTDSCLVLKKALNDIIDFYQNNRVLYQKFKHGLTIISGYKLAMQPATTNIPSSFLCALDHRLQEPQSTCVKVTDDTAPQFQWFNTISILPYWEATFKKYSAIMSDIRKFVNHIVNNHLLWAENCGEDYFPIEKQVDGKLAPTIYTTESLSQEFIKKLEPVIHKIMANIYTINRVFAFELNLKEKALERILKCMQSDQVATIFRSEV